MDDHTPRPWHVERESQATGLVPGGGTPIVRIYARSVLVARVMDEADARLIAAAPELYEACKLALGALDWSELAAAIAKAEGR